MARNPPYTARVRISLKWACLPTGPDCEAESSAESVAESSTDSVTESRI
jgi:hypothetical protein